MNSWLGVALVWSLLVAQVDLLPLPFNQYAYMLAREKIKQQDRAVQAQNKLSGKEKIVNLYLEVLRAHDFIGTKNYFYPSRPIETEMNNITSSPFYRFLTLLPKGGNLHLHEFQVLDRQVFLQSIKNSPEYELLHICDQASCATNMHQLNYFARNVPLGWTRVKDSNWTIAEIVRKTTLTGMLNDLSTPLYPTDTEARWDLANQNGTFRFYAELVKHNATRFNHMTLLLDQAMQENVHLLELRRGLFGNLYYFDANGAQIPISATEEVEMLERFKKEYMAKHPKFIDFVFIIYSGRRSSREQIRAQVNNLLSLQRQFPDFIRGYDMVGEEDQGYTILYHNDNLIHTFNYSQTSNGSFNLLFHAGETNWPEEHIPANHGDGVSTFENIYDALVLRTRRIGHGLSLAKRPDLYEYIRQRQIAIEVCPASNQILGYVADLRNHPGIVYHRSGIPIVLAGDDPGSFGYNQLTVDFYLATMAWGLNLADLKQFAWNSIQHSSLPNDRRVEGFQKWTREWDAFIDTSHIVACSQTFDGATMNISMVLPTYGPDDRSINVTLYGAGFEFAICKNITCKFGNAQTIGSMVNLNEISCPTPAKPDGQSVPVPVSLVVEGKTISSGVTYRFVPSLVVIDDETQISAAFSRNPTVLIILVVLLTLIR